MVIDEFRMTVAAVAASVPLTRNALAAHFGVGARDPVAYVSALLCVSELVGNVVRHAYPDQPGDVEVLVRSDGVHLEMSVTDHGVGFPEPTDPGLGLQIVEALSETVEYERLAYGTRVTAHMVM